MGKTVLITGASTGIGKAAAELFFERGWNVVATMRTPGSGRQDPRWMIARLDVTDAASIAAARDTAIQRFGRIDVLVNNAGYGLVGTFESMDEARIRKQFETNVFGLMRTTRALLPHLRQNRGGTVINVASMGGRLTFPFYSVYHGSKWAVEGFSESLAFELEHVGIAVKIVEPGAILTDFYERSMDFVHDPALSEYSGIVEKGMRRMGEAGRKGAAPRLVAETIWQAATDGSSRLRYAVGSDAKALLAVRRFVQGSGWRSLIKGQLLK